MAICINVFNPKKLNNLLENNFDQAQSRSQCNLTIKRYSKIVYQIDFWMYIHFFSRLLNSLWKSRNIFAHEIIKFGFFFSAAPTAQNSPELKIHIRNVAQDTSAYYSVVSMNSMFICGLPYSFWVEVYSLKKSWNFSTYFRMHMQWVETFNHCLNWFGCTVLSDI